MRENHFYLGFSFIPQCCCLERVNIAGAKGSSVGVREALMEPAPFPVMVLCSAEKSNEKISFLL